MALWHYKCYLVPEPTKFVSEGESEFLPETDENWEWLDCGKEVLEFAEEYFRPVESWSEEILMYGYGEHRIEIGVQEKKVTDVRVRAAVSSEHFSEFMTEILELCDIAGLRIFDVYQNHIVDASSENLKNSILNSNAYKFCKNQERYFEGLDRGEKLNEK
ncbi:hypothetical protein OLMES_3029 [Oleiphilus messinensis]|uniref:Uncharacterized protein n=1 Tax=Oleiphilus messinensis TaxID=141451 RepID=A0A1Y0I981_9GAMM|nr:hypothetical protein [Oleiphilus messinensis]ARU57072.1 hypothetical protein OLMES_3029 [Oleiphilus messinensis]